jgi:3-oxoadipate enol-lactonase
MPYATVDNIRLYYETHGKGIPLLFIHGLGSSSKDWELQITEFAKFYQVILVDLRGHGQSDKPQDPYTISIFVNDIICLIKSLGFSSVNIVGISLGGMVALQLAVHAPQLVRTLIVVNSCPAIVPKTIMDRLRLSTRIALVHLIGIRNTTYVISRKLFPKPEQALLRNTMVERWSQNDRKVYLNSYRAVIGWSVMEKLNIIDCPTLVITGDRDYIPMSLKKECVSRITKADLLVITDSGHATPVDQPEKFNKALFEFLTKHQS